MKNAREYWYETSDLTIFHAAYWMHIKSDPLPFEARVEGGDSSTDSFFEHPEGQEAVYDQCELIESAIRAQLITVTESVRDPNGPLDVKRTRILKTSWLDWCRNVCSVKLNHFFDNKIHSGQINSTAARTNHSKPVAEWIPVAQVMAKDILDDAKQKGQPFVSQRPCAEQVAERLRKEGYTGHHGKPVLPGTVEREALRGLPYWKSGGRQ